MFAIIVFSSMIMWKTWVCCRWLCLEFHHFTRRSGPKQCQRTCSNCWCVGWRPLSGKTNMMQPVVFPTTDQTPVQATSKGNKSVLLTLDKVLSDVMEPKASVDLCGAQCVPQVYVWGGILRRWNSIHKLISRKRKHGDQTQTRKI